MNVLKNVVGWNSHYFHEIWYEHGGFDWKQLQGNKKKQGYQQLHVLPIELVPGPMISLVSYLVTWFGNIIGELKGKMWFLSESGNTYFKETYGEMIFHMVLYVLAELGITCGKMQQDLPIYIRGIRYFEFKRANGKRIINSSNIPRPVFNPSKKHSVHSCRTCAIIDNADKKCGTPLKVLKLFDKWKIDLENGILFFFFFF